MALDTFFAVRLGISVPAIVVCQAVVSRIYRSLIDYQYVVALEARERAGRHIGGEITRRQAGPTSWWSVSPLAEEMENPDGERPEWMIGDLRALTTDRRYRIWIVASWIAGMAIFAGVSGSAIASGS